MSEYGNGVSLLSSTVWVVFTDWLLIFRASSKSHGHLGREDTDLEGELGGQGEAVPEGEVRGQHGVGVGGAWVWCSGWPIPDQYKVLGSDFTRLPSFSTQLGHSGSQVSDEAVGWACVMVEVIYGASAAGVGYCGVGYGARL